MKLLVVSDIHANWPALRAIQEPADAVVCLGDIVSYVPSPRECLAWVRERAAHVVRGNHDTALAAELEEFARKNDYRFATEAVGEEGSSWRRVLDVFVGRPGVFGPERAGEAAAPRAERPAPPQTRGNDG